MHVFCSYVCMGTRKGIKSWVVGGKSDYETKRNIACKLVRTSGYKKKRGMFYTPYNCVFIYFKWIASALGLPQNYWNSVCMTPSIYKHEVHGQGERVHFLASMKEEENYEWVRSKSHNAGVEQECEHVEHPNIFKFARVNTKSAMAERGLREWAHVILKDTWLQVYEWGKCTHLALEGLCQYAIF